MSVPQIPVATYRLQFNRDFTFAKATEILPYLAALGISHCYASPYLRARPGSMHGYDIIDHNQLNPEIGTPEEFEQFVATLHRHNMGQILDVVPNHMGVMGADNAWWLDVLENGEASNYASYFDIDWQPLKDELQGKVLVPVLDDQYGAVLDKGDLKLTFDAEKGEFSIFYYEHRFPVNPRKYSVILGRQGERLAQLLGPENQELLELQSLISAFGHMPRHTETSPEKKAERNRDKEIHKRRLAALCAQSPPILEFIQENVRALNGIPGDDRSFDELHELIKLQAFRLAYWRVAADDINYRRFFDIDDLAALRTEDPQVFELTHRLVMALVREGKVNGLRIDHPDGLFNPAEYFQRVKSAGASYLLVEKILSAEERLPAEWPVQGTTGYDFSNLVNGLFVDTTAAAKISRGYRGFLGQPTLDFREVLYRCKKNVMRNALASELNVLANILSRVALSNRHTCDFTLNSLRNALSEVVANFPVYRTYLTENLISDEDRWYIETALQGAKKRSKSQDTSVFDFIRQVLLNGKAEPQSEVYRQSCITFAMKFQQFTSPVMAKGLEDTSFYRYHALMSVNDVGGNPLKFGVTPDEFHAKIAARARNWPHSMLATSTHDSKLSEDVRARINVLSEIPGQWRLKARQWRVLNQKEKLLLDGVEAPSRNDEYLFYQILLGAWPLGTSAPSREFCGRMKSYMLKAAREAKEFTSWANQNQEYENALASFIDGVLDVTVSQEFLSDFLILQRRVAGFGALNSLSQTLLKLCSPGVPDIYQGNELYEFNLVDPDNRRPVNYAVRQKLLCEFSKWPNAEYESKTKELLENLAAGKDIDGSLKLFLIWKGLKARQRYQYVFQSGEYIPLSVTGAKAKHVVAFARREGKSSAIVAVPRLWAQLAGNETSLPNRDTWQDTAVEFPSDWDTRSYRNQITGQEVSLLRNENGKIMIAAADLFQLVPWVFLLNDSGEAIS